MAKIVIFGTTEMADLNHFYLTHDSPHEVVAFTVDRDYIEKDTLCGLPVVPFEEVELIYPPGECKMRVALWFSRTNKLRAEKYYQAKAKGYELINYISSKAITWPGLDVGDNCWIGDTVVIQPFAKIGNNVTIMTGTSIAHHSVIGDHCFVSGQVAVLGGGKVEPYCFLGGNSTIRNNVTVASGCVIGAGALILQNTLEKRVYAGKSAVMLPTPADEVKV